MNEWLEQHKKHVLSVLLVVIAAGALAFWIWRPRPAPIVISTPAPTLAPTLSPSPTPAPLRVYVSGAVQKPDVYELPPGSIVKDVLLAAGGASDDADLNRVNLALQLHDQQQVHIPRRGEEGPTTAPPPGLAQSTPSLAGKVNINSASVQELESLPGVGPAIAQRIIDYRTENGPFTTIEDLMQVKGIGPATFKKLEGQITTQ